MRFEFVCIWPFPQSHQRKQRCVECCFEYHWSFKGLSAERSIALPGCCGGRYGANCGQYIMLLFFVWHDVCDTRSSPALMMLLVLPLTVVLPCMPFVSKMLMAIVNSAVSILNDLEKLTPVLLDLGARHKSYKVCLKQAAKPTVCSRKKCSTQGHHPPGLHLQRTNTTIFPCEQPSQFPRFSRFLPLHQHH